jgi:hypothetical protein
MARTSYIWWDEVCFILDQHAKLIVYSETSLRVVAPLYLIQPWLELMTYNTQDKHVNHDTTYALLFDSNQSKWILEAHLYINTVWV